MIDNRPIEQLAFSNPVKLARVARIFHAARERRLKAEAEAAKTETNAVPPGGPDAT